MNNNKTNKIIIDHEKYALIIPYRSPGQKSIVVLDYHARLSTR